MRLLKYSLLLFLFINYGNAQITDTDEDEEFYDNIEAINNNVGGDIKFIRLDVTGRIKHRYSIFKIHGEIKNYGNSPEEGKFIIHLPENAFISKAVLVIDDKKINGEVKEKKNAEEIYQQAIQQGQSAGHLATVRDSNNIQVSVNIAPNKSAHLNITYEELLIRSKGRYEIKINLSPEQPPEIINVDVKIKEYSNLTFVKVPPFDSPLAADGKDDERDNPDVLVKWPIEDDERVSAEISYTAENKKNGVTLPGPLIIRYDVDHSAKSGEILLMDGYFVHFLAPTGEREVSQPLPKHAIFVLDSSGSMWGRKLQQVKSAMKNILGQLDKQDMFSVVTFSSSSNEWTMQGLHPNAGKGVYSATSRNIFMAQEHIDRMQASGATNIISGLRRALILARKYQNMTLAAGVSEGENYTMNANNKTIEHPKPIIMFLTDGLPTAGEIRPDRIVKYIKHTNNVNAHIFALAFGDGANLPFLRKLSLQNFGFSRRIYEAADSSLQLQSFYQEISSPLLDNITFTYIDSKINMSSLTKSNFPTLFSGSEVIVAGQVKINNNDTTNNETTIIGFVNATNQENQDINMPKPLKDRNKNDKDKKKQRKGYLERAWAYLTIKQLLENSIAEENNNSTNKTSKDQALKIALQYGFVTPVTSLVMVDRNGTNSNNTGDNKINIKNSQDAIQLDLQNKHVFSVNPLITGRPGAGPGMGFKPLLNEDNEKEEWLEKLPWLMEKLEDDDTLKFNCLNNDIKRKVLRDPPNIAEVDTKTCTLNSTDVGSCRHLANCYKSIESFEMFLIRFCDIDQKYVGVCCLPK